MYVFRSGHSAVLPAVKPRFQTVGQILGRAAGKIDGMIPCNFPEYRYIPQYQGLAVFRALHDRQSEALGLRGKKHAVRRCVELKKLAIYCF